MKTITWFERIASNQRTAFAVNITLVSLMMTCLAIGTVLLGNRIMGECSLSASVGADLQNNCGSMLTWQMGYIPWLTFLFALEAGISRRITWARSTQNQWMYHFSEIIFSGVMLILAVYLTTHTFGQWFRLQDWQSFFNGFFEKYFGQVVVTFVVVGTAWLLSFVLIDYLMNLNSDEGDLDFDTAGKLEFTREAMRTGMFDLLMILGIVLVVMTSMTRMALPAQLSYGPLHTPVLNVVIYFLLAMLLMSLTQMTFLTRRWFYHKTNIPKTLTRRWVAYSLLFFAVMGLVSFLLPTSFTIGFLEVLRSFLILLLNVIFYFLQLIFILLVWFVDLILSLFGRQPASIPENPLPPQISMLPPLGSVSTPQTANQIGIILGWAALVGVVGYAVYYFIFTKSAEIKALGTIPVIGWFVRLFSGLIGWLRSSSTQINQWVESQQEKRRIAHKLRQEAAHTHRIDFRNLPAREKVVFFYLALLQRGAQQGIIRHPAETPGQYNQRLQNALPEEDQPDLDTLGEAFIEARYSPHPIAEEHISLIQQTWKRVMTALKSRQGSPPTGTKPTPPTS